MRKPWYEHLSREELYEIMKAVQFNDPKNALIRKLVNILEELEASQKAVIEENAKKEELHKTIVGHFREEVKKQREEGVPLSPWSPGMPWVVKRVTYDEP